MSKFTWRFATGFTGMVSVYKASIDGGYKFSPTFDVEKNSVAEVMTSPFNLEYFATPDPYLFAAAGASFSALGYFLRHTLDIKAKPNAHVQTINNLFSGLNNIGPAKLFQVLFLIAGLTYMAGVGEEMLFRGVLMPRFEEYLVINNLKKLSPNLSDCVSFDYSEVKRRIEELAPEDRERLLQHANRWANAAQAVLFSGVHGSFVSVPHITMGAVAGAVYGDEGYDIGEAAFAHAWYDFFVFSILLIQAIR